MSPAVKVGAEYLASVETVFQGARQSGGTGVAHVQGHQRPVLPSDESIRSTIPKVSDRECLERTSRPEIFMPYDEVQPSSAP